MAQKPSSPTEGRIRLLHALRAERKRAAKTQREVADALGWSLPKINRIETGQVAVSPTDVRLLMSYYGVVTNEYIESLVDYARLSRRHGWTAFRDVLNPEMRVYLGYEGLASRIWQFEPLVIPGILQTPRYAELMIRSADLFDTDEQSLQRQLQVRTTRHEILDRDDPPTARFVIDESALYRRVGQPGNAEALAQQLVFLKELSARPAMSIQILPFTFGSHYGLTGSFTGLEIDGLEPSMVLLAEHERPKGVTLDPAAVARYQGLFERLSNGASAPAQLPAVVDRALAALDW